MKAPAAFFLLTGFVMLVLEPGWAASSPAIVPSGASHSASPAKGLPHLSFNPPVIRGLANSSPKNTAAINGTNMNRKH